MSKWTQSTCAFIVLFCFALLCSSITAQSTDSCPTKAVKGATFFLAEGRIEIPSPAKPLKAGEPNELAIVFHGPERDCLMLMQSNVADNIPYDGLQSATIQHHADGSAYLVFTPFRAGKFKLNLTANYADGGFVRVERELDAVPSMLEPAALIMQVGGGPSDTDTLVIDRNNPQWQLPGEPGWAYLYPIAYYWELKLPVSIDPRYLSYSIEQPVENPVVQLNEQGGMKPLRIGEALLTTRFGNTTRTTCILVRESLTTFDPSPCLPLVKAKTTEPLNTVWSRDPEGMRSEFRPFGFFSQRLAVTAPNHAVKLGQTVEVAVRLSHQELRSLQITQRIAAHPFPNLDFDFYLPAQSNQTSFPATAGLLWYARRERQKSLPSSPPLLGC